MTKDGVQAKLVPWDWWYYAEKLQKAKYDLDDEILRPYFKLENVRDGAFDVARKLWGLKFVERTDIPKYHPDVQVFEVKEADGRHLGVFYVDYFPARPSAAAPGRTRSGRSPTETGGWSPPSSPITGTSRFRWATRRRS